MRHLHISLLFVAAIFAACPSGFSQANPDKKLVFKPGSKTPETNAEKPAAPTPAPNPPAETATVQTSSAEEPLVNTSGGHIGEPYPGLDPAVQKQIQNFFILIQRGKSDTAYDSLLKDTVIEGDAALIVQLKQKTKQAVELFGEIRSHEILELRKVGKSLLSVTCVSLGERLPLRWKFYFYQSRDAWRLIDINVDDRLPALFSITEDPAATPAPPARVGR